MRTWTKSARVVLAWSILPIILVAVGMKGSTHQAQANTRTAGSTTEVILTSTSSVAAAPATATHHTTRYTVAAGDTLSGIAARFGVRGGWPALYAANRRAIGPDPDVIRAGTVLRLGRPAPSPRTPGRAHPRQHPPEPPAGPRHHPLPGAPRMLVVTGMPRWLKTMLLTVGLLILVAFLAEPVLVIRRRRQQATARQAATKEAVAQRATAQEATAQEATVQQATAQA